MTRRHFLIVAVVFTVAAAAVPAWRLLAPARAGRVEAPPVVAYVNGRAIPRDEFDLRLSQILPMASFHGRVEPARLLGFGRAALDELILDELIYQRAAARGASTAADEIDRDLSLAKGRFESEEEFQQALAEIGLTERAFRQRLERLAVIRRERAAHQGHEPTEAELRTYFELNGAKFERPEQVRLFEILVAVDPAEPASASRAEQQANEIARRLRRGEPFEPLARARSDDEYRLKGGDFGFVHRGRLDEELDRAVFAAATGAVTIVRTIYGFHVFRVTERVPATRLTYDEARPHLVERLRRQYREDDARRFRRDLLTGARIDIVDEALRTATPAEIPDITPPGPGRSLPGTQPRARRVGEAS